ncbi:MAG: spondin domain-containing protein [Bryobacteraceae bacterium]
MKRILLAALLIPAAAAFADDDERGSRFAVTVTNITAHQVFTPIVVASHREGVRLFSLGQAAGVPLEVLAEGGDTAPLKTMLMSNPAVKSVADSGAPLGPGQSVTVMVDAQGAFDHISLASMLVPTNDAFLALNGVEGPKGSRTLALFSPAYDAGTEANDENCASIPGPPSVCTGQGFNESRAGAEGFVHIHRGIHGIASLMAARWDWRNPVAYITIRRVR